MKANQFFSLGMAMILTLSALAGCGQQDAKNEKENNKNTAKGRYMETEIVLPEEAMSVYDMVKLEDGTMRIVGSNQEAHLTVWDYHEQDSTWSMAYDPIEEIQENDTHFIDRVALSPKGDVVAKMIVIQETEDSQEEVTMETEESAVELSEDGDATYVSMGGDVSVYYHLNAKGQLSEIPVETEKLVYFMDYSEEGQLLMVDVKESVISQLDVDTGKITKTYGNGKSDYFGTAHNTLYIVSDKGDMEAYDLESKEQSEEYQELKDAISQSGINFSMTNLDSQPLILCGGKEEGEVYYANAKGIYRYVKNGSVVEQLLDGALVSLSDPDIQLKTMEMAADDSFYVLGSAVSSYTSKLYHYTYNPDVAAVPDLELKAYTLYENPELQQNIAQYQKEHPEVYINLETAITQDNSVTVSDALRTLSTEIMAGNGPDILMLDKMPVNSYIEQGLLEDISDILEGQENLFENILSAGEKDGKTYGIPLRFAVPMIQAKEEVLE